MGKKKSTKCFCIDLETKEIKEKTVVSLDLLEKVMELKRVYNNSLFKSLI